MNKKYIKKSCEVCNRIGQELNRIPHTASFFPELRPLAKDYLISIRHLIRHVIRKKELWEIAIRLYKRAIQDTLIAEDIILFNKVIIEIQESIKEYEYALIDYGHRVMSVMNWWQKFGADYTELFELCGVEITRANTEHGIDVLQDKPAFANLLFVYNLDYRRTGDFIEEKFDGPFTHAINAYYRSLIGTVDTRAVFDEFLNQTNTIERV